MNDVVYSRIVDPASDAIAQRHALLAPTIIGASAEAPSREFTVAEKRAALAAGIAGRGEDPTRRTG